MSGVVTVRELLDGHAVLDIECLDRIYLNGYVPTLQVSGQVVTFLHDHRGMPIASPAVFEQNGHEHSKQAAARARIGFTELSNGFAACEDPDGLQLLCDRLGPGDIQAFFDRWMCRTSCVTPPPENSSPLRVAGAFGTP